MNLANMIGALLVFKHDGIDEKSINLIKQDDEVKKMSILANYDMSKVCYELLDYDDCFVIKENVIDKTVYYKHQNLLFKERFFDILSNDEKRIIYKLLCRL